MQNQNVFLGVELEFFTGNTRKLKQPPRRHHCLAGATGACLTSALNLSLRPEQTPQPQRSVPAAPPAPLSVSAVNFPCLPLGLTSVSPYPLSFRFSNAQQTVFTQCTRRSCFFAFSIFYLNTFSTSPS